MLSPFFAVAGMSHIADDIAGSHNAAFFSDPSEKGNSGVNGRSNSSTFIKTADADTPTVYASKNSHGFSILCEFFSWRCP